MVTFLIRFVVVVVVVRVRSLQLGSLIAFFFQIPSFLLASALTNAWSVAGFFIYYAMVFACIILYFGHKLIAQTKLVALEDADLVWDKPVVDAYEASIVPPQGLWEDIWQSVLRLTRKM